MQCPTLKDLPLPPKEKTGWLWTEESPRLPDAMPTGRPWPRITIVTPNYNYGRFIEETIRSVLLQGYPNLEYIIIDGGSTDNSIEIIKKYEKWLTFWTVMPKCGQAHTINEGFLKGTGEIFGWLNSDDILCSEALKDVSMKWLSVPSCHFLTGDGIYVDSMATKSRYDVKADKYSFKDLLSYHKRKYLPQPSVFFSREAFNKVKRLDGSLKYTMDLDLWLRIRKIYPIYYLPKVLSRLRYHDNAMTLSHRDEAMKEVMGTVSRYLNDVNYLERLSIRIGLRYLVASAICRCGLEDYFNKDIQAAKKSIKEALYITPLIIFSLAWIRLFLRIVLPANFKNFLLKNP